MNRDSFRPLTVTAYTPAGFAAGDPWSPALDGIIGYAFEREVLGADFGTNLDLKPVDGLPLAIVRHDGLWWYEVGFPETSTPLQQRDKHFHRRFNSVDAETWFDGRKVETAMGPHKNLRKPHLVTTCASVSWKCIGDAAEILRLASQISNVGSGHSRGLGAIARWEVTDGFDGSIRRAVPVAYAEEHGLKGSRAMHAIRPPKHILENQVMCILPEPQREAELDSDDWFVNGVCNETGAAS
jgi:CRISPR type IV-associated protein Csf3